MVGSCTTSLYRVFPLSGLDYAIKREITEIESFFSPQIRFRAPPETRENRIAAASWNP
jgi:hypothetical protein